MSAQEPLYVIFDGPPSHESGRFVEVETADGKSVSVGNWENYSGKYWRLGPLYAEPKAARSETEPTRQPVGGEAGEVVALLREEAVEDASLLGCRIDETTPGKAAALIEAQARQLQVRHSNIAKAVFETVQDAAATWDTASDELIWGAYDVNGPQFQPVSDEHLAATCVRFPQWADDLKSLAQLWNTDEHPTEEELEAVEVSEEEVQRGTRRALQLMRFYDKLRKAESERDALRARHEAPCEEVEAKVHRMTNGSTGAVKETVPAAYARDLYRKWQEAQEELAVSKGHVDLLEAGKYRIDEAVAKVYNDTCLMLTQKKRQLAATEKALEAAEQRAAEAVAREREACADVADACGNTDALNTAAAVAAAIRARSEGGRNG